MWVSNSGYFKKKHVSQAKCQNERHFPRWLSFGLGQIYIILDRDEADGVYLARFSHAFTLMYIFLASIYSGVSKDLH